jgi:hypothetical protein
MSAARARRAAAAEASADGPEVAYHLVASSRLIEDVPRGGGDGAAARGALQQLGHDRASATMFGIAMWRTPRTSKRPTRR